MIFYITYGGERNSAPHKPSAIESPTKAICNGAGAALTASVCGMKPNAKAATLARFLKDHVKAAVMEAKVEGNSLTITTTPDAQKAIGQLVSLMHEQTSKNKAAPPAFRFLLPSTRSTNPTPNPIAS